MLIVRHYSSRSVPETEQFVKDSFRLRQFACVYFNKVLHYSALSRYESLIPAATLKQINQHIVQMA